MQNQAMETAIEIFAKLVNQEEVSEQGVNSKLYDAWNQSGEVYELVVQLTRALNLELYDYNNGLYLSPGGNNAVFGFTNEELRAALGIRVNRQLFLCYFIIYNIITKFYTDSATYTYQDYVKIHEIVENVTLSFHRVFQQIQTVVFTEVEEYSFKEIALLWEQMPDVSTEAGSGVRAEMGSRTGLVKKVFNFLEEQGLFTAVEEMYYPTARFKALIERYFVEHQSRIYEVMMGGEDDAAY